MKNKSWRLMFVRAGLVAFLLTGMLTTNGFAQKGGKGGGKGGGDDAPTVVLPDVRYEVTPIALPGTSYYFNNSNDAGAAVGWYLGDFYGRRALAYLPWISETQAFDLNDPVLGIVGIPDGWHLRSAIDINNHGDIVGNIEPNDTTDPRRLPVYLDLSAVPPTATIMGPFDANAVDEHGCCINDSGDIVVCSTGVSRLFVGNPGLYGNPQVAFHEIDFEAITGTARYNHPTQIPLLSNRINGLPAVLASRLDSSNPDQVFRMATDSSWFEFADSYMDDSGDWLDLNIVGDLNHDGDVAGVGLASRQVRKNRVSTNAFAVRWQSGSSALEPIAADSAYDSPWYSARINNDGDAAGNNGSGGPFALAHGGGGTPDGPINITDLIHPDDPNASMFSWVDELTDTVSIGVPESSDPLDQWPMILGGGTVTVDGMETEVMVLLKPVAFQE